MLQQLRRRFLLWQARRLAWAIAEEGYASAAPSLLRIISEEGFSFEEVGITEMLANQALESYIRNTYR